MGPARYGTAMVVQLKTILVREAYCDYEGLPLSSVSVIGKALRLRSIKLG